MMKEIFSIKIVSESNKVKCSAQRLVFHVAKQQSFIVGWSFCFLIIYKELENNNWLCIENYNFITSIDEIKTAALTLSFWDF